MQSFFKHTYRVVFYNSPLHDPQSEISAGGKTPQKVSFSHSDSCLTTNAILIGNWHEIPARHYSGELHSVYEITMRLKHILHLYNDDLAAIDVGLTPDLSLILCLIISFQMYEAYFATTLENLEVWQQADFLSFCSDCFSDKAREEDLQPAQLDVLTRIMMPTRSLFSLPVLRKPALFEYCREKIPFLETVANAATIDT